MKILLLLFPLISWVCKAQVMYMDNSILGDSTTRYCFVITNRPNAGGWFANIGGNILFNTNGSMTLSNGNWSFGSDGSGTFYGIVALGVSNSVGLISAVNGGFSFNGTPGTDKQVIASANGRNVWTNYNAADLSGTIPDARLSSNVALLNANQTFSGANIFSNTTFNSSSGARTLTPNVAAGQDPTNRGVYVASGLLRFEGNGGFYSTNTGGGGGGNTYIPMFVGANGSGFQFQTGSKALTIARPDGGVVFFDFDGAGNISDQPLNVIGALRSTTTIAAGTTITATNGFASYASNLTAPVSIGSSVAATNGGFNWTNNTGLDISVFIDNQGVTATSIKKNGGQIFSSALGDQTIPLHPNQWISILYAVGTPTISYTP